LALAVVFMFVDNYVLDAEPEPVEVATAQTPAEEPVAREKSIAVLPFANMSGDPEQEFFSDGVSEELLNVLARVKGLRVTSRTSAFAFKDKDVSIPEIAEELGVEHVLEGSVRMAGNRVRITTQLIEVATDSHLWSESYDRELSDIFAVQDEIAAKVGEALRLALLGADSRPIRPSPETSIEVYTDYLLARQQLVSPTVHTMGEAERLLKSVIERDPGYAPAHAALAATYLYMAFNYWLSPREASARMLPVVEQALSLDPDLAEAWQHLAYVRQASGDLEGARAARERALELDPRDPLVLGGQIRHWFYTHEPERGLVYADELLRVDPLSPLGLIDITYLYGRLGRFDDAEAMLERIRSIDPQNTYYWWAASYLAIDRGDLATAIRAMEEFRKIDLYESEGDAVIALLYLDLGDVAAAEFWKQAALRRDPESPHARLAAALLHLYGNEEAEALAIARELTRPGVRTRGAETGALRVLAAPDLTAENHQDVIDRYLAHYPALADGRIPVEQAALGETAVRYIFFATLDLAAAYLRAGEEGKADSLLSLVGSELPHWPRTMVSGHGFADVELHALRGEKEQALAALREHAAMGTRYWWRWELFYNPNLDSIRDTPEFSAIVAEIEADMAAQLERVREMGRRGELVLPAEPTAPRDDALDSPPRGLQ
jgi:TolB-like protein/tetratricopeptide (TPR) repeat protein